MNMPVEFDTDYYLSKATEIEKKAKGTEKIVASRIRFVLTEAKKKHTPMLDVLDSLEEEAGTKASVFSRKLKGAVAAIRLREDLEL
jgi:hypothetical protein